jgi:hypothetical protein
VVFGTAIGTKEITYNNNNELAKLSSGLDLIPFLETIDTILVGEGGFCNRCIAVMTRFSHKPAPTTIGSLFIKNGITTGDDTYTINADLAQGASIINETENGGTDTLNFSGNTSINIDLAQSTAQTVNANLVLTVQVKI